MDKGSIYIGAILIALCIIPLIYFWWSRKKKENLIKERISQYAKEHNCELTKIDITANMAIGIDESKKHVFFYKKEKDKEVNQFVDLSTVLSCIVDKSMYAAASSIVDSLELKFYFKIKTANPITFKFFNRDSNSQLSDELLLINEWQAYISQILKRK